MSVFSEHFIDPYVFHLANFLVGKLQAGTITDGPAGKPQSDFEVSVMMGDIDAPNIISDMVSRVNSKPQFFVQVVGAKTEAYGGDGTDGIDSVAISILCAHSNPRDLNEQAKIAAGMVGFARKRLAGQLYGEGNPQTGEAVVRFIGWENVSNTTGFVVFSANFVVDLPATAEDESDY